MLWRNHFDDLREHPDSKILENAVDAEPAEDAKEAV
jgi:hypothetical protein